MFSVEAFQDRCRGYCVDEEHTFLPVSCDMSSPMPDHDYNVRYRSVIFLLMLPSLPPVFQARDKDGHSTHFTPWAYNLLKNNVYQSESQPPLIPSLPRMGIKRAKLTFLLIGPGSEF
jgi:hypothetical protein